MFGATSSVTASLISLSYIFAFFDGMAMKKSPMRLSLVDEEEEAVIFRRAGPESSLLSYGSCCAGSDKTLFSFIDIRVLQSTKSVGWAVPSGGGIGATCLFSVVGWSVCCLSDSLA